MIEKFLNVIHIRTDLEVADKNSAIDHMVYLAARNNNVDTTDLKERLKVREKHRTSGFGKGVAVPHTFTSKLDQIVMSVAILKNPIEWNSLDKKPVRLIALTAGPVTMMEQFMALLLRLSKVVADDYARADILKQKTIQDVYERILYHEKMNS